MKFVKNIIVKTAAFFKQLTQPICVLLTSVWSIVEAVVSGLFKLPADIIAAFLDHILKWAQNLGGSLDAASASAAKKRKLRRNRRECKNCLKPLDFFTSRYAKALIGNGLILAFQFASFFTTLRGLNQVLGGLHPHLAIIMALAIQVGLAFLSATITASFATRSYQSLCLLFLFISVCFSYCGVAETQFPYRDYAAEVYETFEDSCHTLAVKMIDDSSNACDADAVVDTAYDQMQRLLENARSACNNRIELQNKIIAENTDKVTTVVMTSPTYIKYSVDGTPFLAGGGSYTTTIPDTDAIAVCDAAKAEVARLEQQMETVDKLSTEVTSTYNREMVKHLLATQLVSGDDPSFSRMCGTVSGLVNNLNALAEELKVPDRVDFDLLQAFYSCERAQEAYTLTIKSFSDIEGSWRAAATNTSANDKFWIFALIDRATASTPDLLQASVQEEIDRCYHSFSRALNARGMQNEFDSLTELWKHCRLQNPFMYDLANLQQISSMESGAWIALAWALFNDITALFVGCVLCRYHINIQNPRAVSPSKLYAYREEGLHAVVAPLIDARLKAAELEKNPENVYKTFNSIMSDFFGLFTICPQLVPSKGYCRYRTDSIPEEFAGLVTYLTMQDLIRCEPAKTVAAMDKALVDKHKDATSFLLLRSAGELWLADITGNSSDFITSMEYPPNEAD